MYFDKSIDNIIEDNMMDFSQYVIKNRALPCLYSGIKPIHLKILWTMFEENITKFTKSETVAGKVMAYSPHGSSYETMVYMAQTDRHIHPLLIGQGNFGSYCSSELMYASGRYTECKLSDISLDSLEGINKHMVDMIDNYDNTRKMPQYLPTKFPLILCMAHNGIAVGMASNTPSFNLSEVCDATIDIINGAKETNLIPDFATGGCIIKDDKVIKTINHEGVGSVKLKAKYKIEGNTIIINEIPYGSKVSVETIINKIIDLVKIGKIKEITNVLNQTGYKGLSIEIECKKGTDMDKLMNKLYALTPLSSNFNCNMNVLVGKNPMVLGVYDTIQEWLKFRRMCISKGLSYDINIKSSKLHNLKGLEKVLLDIDKCIEIIRKSEEELIIPNLIQHFKIDETQANSIANMKLRNINKNYILKQTKDIRKLEDEINELKSTLNSEDKINQLILSQLEEVKSKYGKPRMTEIIYEDDLQEISADELIEDNTVTLCLTSEGYIKKNRKYSENQKLKNGDSVTQLFQTTNNTDLLFFTSKGRLFVKKTYNLEDCQPSQLGQYIPNILDSLQKDERVIHLCATKDWSEDLLCIFENGYISRMSLLQQKPRQNRKVAIDKIYNTKNQLISIATIKQDVNIMLITQCGHSLIINTNDINPVKSKNSLGIVGIKLDIENMKDDKIIFALINIDENTSLTLRTEKNKEMSILLNDILPDNNKSNYDYYSGRRGRIGNFIYNCRQKKDRVIEVKVNK